MTSKLTVTGRASHFISIHFPGVVNFISRNQSRIYARFQGRHWAKFNRKPVFRLVVRGRKTGQPRQVMLTLIRRGDDLLVCGSQGGTPTAPNWWNNLVAAGRAEVQVGDQAWEVDAHVVTDAEDYAEAWALLIAGHPDFATFQALTERVLPLAYLTRRPAQDRSA